MEITNFEQEALKAITDSDYYESGRTSIVWDWSAYDNCSFTGKTRSGVFSSLSQKGLIYISEGQKKFTKDEAGNKILNRYWDRSGHNYGTIYITEAGYALLDSKGLIDANGHFIRS